MWNRKIIDEKKAQLEKLRPFPQNTLKSLQEKIALEWTYHSNSIEGNTLTLKETKVVLEGMTIGGKSLKEHLEAINHKKAIQYLNELVTEQENLSEWQIKQIHALVLKKIDQANAGLYRKENVLISGAKHTPPDYIHVPDEMKNLLTRYQEEWKDLHPLERASLLHIEFVKIHPFVDGNGRTSRLLQNFELMKEGFPPIVIKKEKRLEYYEALDKAHTLGEIEDFIKLSAECLNESLDLYLNTIKGDDYKGPSNSNGNFKKTQQQIQEQNKTKKTLRNQKQTISQEKNQNKAQQQSQMQGQNKTQQQNRSQEKTRNQKKLRNQEQSKVQEKLRIKDQTKTQQQTKNQKQNSYQEKTGNQKQSKTQTQARTFPNLINLHKKWLSIQPLSKENHQALWQWIRLQFNHHSNSFEGNTLSYEGTKLLLLHGRTVGDHTLREYEEMKAHNVAFQYMCKLAKDNRPLREADIRDFNKICLKEPFYQKAQTMDGQPTQKKIIPGQYKTQPNHVVTQTGETFYFASPEETPSKMEEFTKWIQAWLKQGKDKQHQNLISFLAELHQKFIFIHPFDDGNGRVVRLLLAYVLIRLDFLPIVLTDRKKYIKAIHFTDAGNIQPLENLFLENLIAMLEKGISAKKHKVSEVENQKERKSNSEEESIARPSFREDESSQIPALQLLQNMGWTYLEPEEALSLRKNNIGNVLLEDILEPQLRKINKIKYKGSVYPFKDENILNAIQELSNIPFEGLIKTSEKIFDLLTLGKSYKENIKGDRKSYDLKYIDWEHPENNVYHVTDEYNVETHNFDGRKRRPDIVLFLNGIPVVVIECKRPDMSDPIEEAVSQQIRNQKNTEIPQLFVFSQILIALCPSPLKLNKNRCRYATTGTAQKFWYPWKEQSPFQQELEGLIRTPLPEDQKEKLFASRYQPFRNYFERLEKAPRQITNQDLILYALCQPKRLLEFIKKFILYDAGTKKIARYQQYFAVKDTLKRITSGEPNQKRPDGVIWHTQGSGKSLSMVMLAKAIVMEKKIKEPKVILITDRVNLDEQIYKTFDNCQVPLKKATSGANLVEILKSYKSTVIATTIFKFDTVANSKGILLDSKDIIILIDEAHRTQYGKANAKVRKVFPKACFIAYTGTPLTKTEKHTLRKFGDFIGTPYTSREALEDQAILPLLYEGRLVPQEISKKLLDRMFERLTKDLTKEQKSDLKKKYNRNQQLAKTEQRLFMIASDISLHFSRMWKGKGFKGQLAVNSISSAFKYQKYFKELGEISTAVIVSKPDDRKDHADTKEDETALQKHEREIRESFGDHRQYEKEMIAKFDSPEEPDILIVVHKLLTGFDVPRNTILYIDKPLEGHTLLQATARVNRVFPNKDFGYVIDYHGNLQKFLEALAHFDKLAEKAQDMELDLFDRQEIQSSIRKISEEIKKLPQYYSELLDLFHAVQNKRDLSEYENSLFKKETREDFYKKCSKFGNSLHQALSSADFLSNTSFQKIKKYKKELKFFCKLKNHIQKIYAESVDYRDYEPKIENLLNTYVQAGEVQTLVPPTNIYDQEFNLQLKDKSDKSKALMILHNTKKYISDNMEKDTVFYERLSKLLEETLSAYQKGRLSEVEFLQKALRFKDEALTRTGDKLPSSLEGKESAKAFFGILKKVIEQDNKLEEKTINHIADMSIKISQIIEEHRIVDWFFFKSRDIENRIKNKIEDYIYEEKGRRGFSLDFDSMDRIMDETLKTAKSQNL